MLHFLLGAVRFDMLDLDQYAFLMKSVHFFPNQDPQIGVRLSWDNTVHFSFPQPIGDPFAIIVHRR